MEDARLPLLEEEEIRHIQHSTSLHQADGSPEQRGTLFITTKRVAFLSDAPSASQPELVCYTYPSIGLHAICTDPANFPVPCLYLQIEAEQAADGQPGPRGGQGRSRETGIAAWMNGHPPDTVDVEQEGAEAHGNGLMASGDGDEAEDGEPLVEVRLVPMDASALDVIFRAMSACAALHPCGDDDDDAEEDDDAFGGGDMDGGDFAGGVGGYQTLGSGQLPAGFFTGEGELTAQQQAMLDHFDSILQVGEDEPADAQAGAQSVGELLLQDPQRFADADADERATAETHADNGSRMQM